MTTHTMARMSSKPLAMDPQTRDPLEHQKAGGAAALYLALALLVAIPYFLLVVDYPGASTPAEKVALVADHYASLYAIYLATYVVFGVAIGVLTLALRDRLRVAGPVVVRIGTLIGLLWSFTLVASGLVFTYGMTAIEALPAGERALTWQAVEPIALALGGAGGELLGGLWVLLISVAALRGGSFPKALGWLGVVIGLVGITSVVPLLHDATIAFGLLEIVWFAWVGVFLLMTKAIPARDRGATRHLPVG